MKRYVFRADVTNFGDELNDWLIPRVFPNFFDEDESQLLLAIGSIIFEHEPRTATKIVLGSGYGGYAPLPEFNETWKIYSVRGPRTAVACGLEADKVSGDTAILINRYLPELRRPKRHKASFIPHWESVPRGNWAAVCAAAGLHYIDPRLPVPDVLDALAASEVVVAEAMHGAIVADALRVPWIPIMPIHHTHRMKWHDWAEALDLSLSPQRLSGSTALEAGVSIFGREREKLRNPPLLWRPFVKAADRLCFNRAVRDLEKAAQTAPNLSSDTAIDRSVSKLEEAVAQIKHDFAK